MISHFDPGSEDPNTAFGKTIQWWEKEVGGEFNLEVVAADIYPTKLMAKVSAKNAPDLVMVDHRGWMPRLAVQNVIAPWMIW